MWGLPQRKTLHCTFSLIWNAEKKEDFSVLNVGDKIDGINVTCISRFCECMRVPDCVHVEPCT